MKLKQTELFDRNLRVRVPVSKEKNGTSDEAARAIAPRIAVLQGKALGALRDRGPHTADQVAEILGEDVLTIRPRISELFKMNKIEKTGGRAPSSRGRASWIWRAKA
jgi:predicted HTH transcriptional regulator